MCKTRLKMMVSCAQLTRTTQLHRTGSQHAAPREASKAQESRPGLETQGSMTIAIVAAADNPVSAAGTATVGQQ